jgi:hypothetical protein
MTRLRNTAGKKLTYKPGKDKQKINSSHINNNINNNNDNNINNNNGGGGKLKRALGPRRSSSGKFPSRINKFCSLFNHKLANT